ncbi:MAG: ImuA family protein [Shimia sp.]|uniref:ImuA family protein n=1 Tax=Shimia sp. TaxID=1954381 RepID=UPI004058610F
MSTHLLSRRSERPRAALAPVPEVSLTLTRLHEACGGARHTFALWLARHTQGPVFWIAPDWGTAPLNPDGMLRFIHPGRVTFVAPRRPDELLWCMEEILRAGIVPLVVADLPGPPGLTPVRRLHLAAETGAAETGQKPLGLILTPGDGGAQGIESRWHMAPAHSQSGDAWRLTRLRARTAAPASWHVTQLTDKPALSAESPEAALA